MSFVKLSRIPPKFKYFRPIRAIDDTKITKPFLKKINLKPVKSIAFSFNPFFGRTESIRKASLLISHPKWRATNPGVLTKTTVKSDCSPPLMEILYGLLLFPSS
ncbi:unnamed protein product [Calicophoron daubneyi]|uniref:Uncharacterized protein n=1 Tax=Calicophoron daubneyi TaxID=300641 RepID=A0AAV2TCJ0_CALDB